MSYIRDWFSNPQRSSNEPVYIFDIGAGVGKLGFLIVYHLFEQKELWPAIEPSPFMYFCLQSFLKFSYVLTDFAPGMIEYWERDTLIGEFINMGYMDYGYFDAEHSTDLHLRSSNLTISLNSLYSPPFILCNSVLSQLPHDAVLLEEGHMKAGVVSLIQPISAELIDRKTDEEIMAIPGKSIESFE